MAIGQRMPGDARVAADLRDGFAVAGEERRLVETDQRYGVPASGEAGQIGQDLRPSERIGHPVIGQIKDTRRRAVGGRGMTTIVTARWDRVSHAPLMPRATTRSSAVGPRNLWSTAYGREDLVSRRPGSGEG